ncbi:MAG: endonuclease/exonuclease/phosphatase family protein [Gaiellaceae bacterium]
MARRLVAAPAVVRGVASRVPVAGTPAAAPRPLDTLELLSWNIGYAGLGRESDFFVDGGRELRPSSRALVEKNAQAIAERLAQGAHDVVLLQEVARDGWLTRGVDVLDCVRDALPGYQLAFCPTIDLSHVPLVGKFAIGTATLARCGIANAFSRPLPSPRLLPGVVSQRFTVLETALCEADEHDTWVVFNVHLSAFDDGVLRRQQLVDVWQCLRDEFDRGSRVVAAGDWNFRLAATSFPYSTEEKNTFWVRDLPADLTPPGWRWAIDPATPTNRTVEQPYRADVNFTSVIDGFVLSPNVDVVAVETIDLGFENSDHNPVRLSIRKRDA